MPIYQVKVRNYIRSLTNNSQAPQTIPMQQLGPLIPSQQNLPDRPPVTVQRVVLDHPPIPPIDERERLSTFPTVQSQDNHADMDMTGLEKYELLQYIGSVSKSNFI